MSVVEINIAEIESRLTGAHDKDNFDALNTLVTHFMRTDPVRAMDYAKKALATASKLNSLEELSQVWYAMGALNLILGQTNAALPFLKKAVKALDELGDLAKKTRAVGNLANAYSNTGQLDKAEKQYGILVKEFEVLGEHVSRAKTLYNLGNLYMKTNRFDKALESYKAALKIYDKYPSPISQSDTLCMLGAVYGRLMDYEKNLKCCHKAFALIEKEDNPYQLGIVSCALGNAYLFLDQFDKAKEYYHKALEIGRTYNIPYHIASNLTNLAELHCIAKKYEEALPYALEALKFDKKTDLPHYLAQDYYMLGRIHHLLGHWEEAGKYLKTCAKLAHDNGLNEIWICCATLQIWNYTSQRQFAKGIRLLEPLEKALQDDTVSELYLYLVEAAANLYAAKGDFKLSNEYFSNYHEITKEFIQKESLRRAQYLQVAFETERKEKEKRWLAKKNRELEERVREEVQKHREKDRLLAEQENMALLGRITAGIAHEINNPLTAIKQVVEITLKSLEKKRGRDLYLSEKQTDVYKMLGRINRLVEIIKVISHSPDRFTSRPFNVNDMIVEFTELFSDRILSEDVTLLTDLEDKLPMVEGDAIRFIQVLSILINNSNDAFTQLRDKRIRKIKIQTELVDEKIQIEVSDNGPGMTAAHIAKAKQPFFSTKDVDKGMGMGLAIAISIVNNMRGELNINSKLSKGTRVLITLPVQKSTDLEEL